MNEEQARIFAEIQKLTRRYFDAAETSEFVPGETPVRLMLPSYDWREINSVLDSLFSTMITLNQSQGNKVAQFEEAWSRYVGVDHGVLVNSGSSANLLALFVLANPTLSPRIERGDEVITPAVTWHTTISPILSVGAVPVLIDVKLEDYTIDTDAIEAEITPRTRAIMPVHLLGNRANMDAIGEIARRHDLYVIEDTCEAHGAELGGRRCGSLGDIGTFSFFFSHHMTTMEGGMLVTANEELAETARIMRSQGVIRNTKRRAELEAHYRSIPEYSDLDPGFIFANLGFNLRPTELNGGFGLEQLKKFGGFLAQRRSNGKYWSERMEKHEEFFYVSRGDDDERAWFCFPLTLKPGAPFCREQLVRHLNDCGIETRPVMAGDVTAHPALKQFSYRAASIENARYIHKHGFFWGNHQAIRDAERSYVADCVDRFVAEHA